MSTHFQFYEKVVVAKSDAFPKMVGEIGYVLGIGAEKDGTVSSYAISFPNRLEAYSFSADDLKSTGEFGDRSMFYDDDPSSQIRVRVVDGKGYLVEK